MGLGKSHNIFGADSVLSQLGYQATSVPSRVILSVLDTKTDVVAQW